MAPKTTRNYTYVDIIREIRRERSEQAIEIARKAIKLGLPRREAIKLAAQVALYELTPEEAERRLRELAGKAGNGGRAR